ncbi:hypothetical protein Aph01nite_78920 [Acrocarpospora phusangensis]|uniref:Methyltransferase domain-containing protein n=1 Tax=Acrocarpospora phusangensis TaxID=1070424 RepID=A0A919UST4_9ACTN|nr:class I SAM-dependent methyltransferase [Acrocarpospora phusangensis]GIH29582.1 hypothetical protein Aph01nite_78920 [Acrocarpospora phusangensis]
MRTEELAARWREQLEAWAIPPEILAQAPADPWTHRVERFATRTARMVAEPKGPTYERSREASPTSVLDVGAGTGAASLGLLPAKLIAVDENPGMLAELSRRAPEATTILGRWPDVAKEADGADVVICSHVVFNVPDLVPFLTELTAHARRRVVLELPRRHPTSWLTPLWSHFHGLARPTGPTSDDVAALCLSLGYDIRQETHLAPDAPYETVEEMADAACRRLCLDPARAPEVIEVAEWPLPRATYVTLWWDVSPR